MSDGCQHICSHGGISPSTDVKRMRANWGAQYNQGACGVCIYIQHAHTRAAGLARSFGVYRAASVSKAHASSPIMGAARVCVCVCVRGCGSPLEGGQGKHLHPEHPHRRPLHHPLSTSRH